MVQPLPLPLTVSCFSKIQIGFTFLVPAHPGSPGQRASEVMTLCRYTNLFIIILAHQHKVCKQLKIKQEMTAVGD